MHRNRCQEVQGDVEAALSDHFGQPVGLTLIVDDGASAAAAPAGPPEESPGGPRPSSPASASAASPPIEDGPEPHPEPPAGAPESGPTPAGSLTLDVVDDDEEEDGSTFDESELGEIADVDNSAEARVLQAFPGAEEVL
jgi:hypothetical protein